MKHQSLVLWFSALCLFVTLALWGLQPAPISQAQTAVPPAAETGLQTAVSPAASQFRTTLIATADTYVSSANPNTNYGLDPDLQVSLSGVFPSNVFKRTLLAFDLSEIPANAEILTATLRLYSEFNQAQTAVPQAPADSIINVYAIDAAWSETAVTYATRPTSTYRNDPPASYVFTGWTEWDVRNTVSGWVAGDYPNYGFWLSTGVQESAYWQSRNAGVLNMPRLEITYATQGSPLWVQATADTWVDQAAPSTNYNNDANLRVGRVGATGSQSHTLLKFDLADLPANVQVTDARLELYSELNLAHATAGAPDAPLALSVYPDAVLADWNPATVTWNNKPTAVNVGDPPATPIYGSWSQWNVTNIVDGWVSGLRPNYGLLLRPGSSDNQTHYFYALPAVKSARLIISYEPICYPPTGVAISGVTQGSTGAAYTFDTAVTGDPTLPITYTWSATDQTPASGPETAVTYTWNTPGVKTVAVTVAGCGGSVSDSHTVTISAPPPACDVALSDLSLSGPTQGITGTLYTFNAAASPANASLPITYTWAATGQTPQTIVGGLTSSKQYTWPDAGSKEIVVTAANCGAAFQRTHTIAVQSRDDLPDLTTGSLWYDSAAQRVGLILGNDGGSAAPAGHIFRLYRDNVAVGEGTYTAVIPAGGLRDAYVDYAWQCTGATATIKVCADAAGLIDERSETNNCREETWACDLNPPAFTSGPIVDQITEHTARISWQSSEATTGEVYVSGQGFSYGPPVLSSTPGLSHQVIVSGLQADRDYRFQVVLVDGGQNRSNSPEQFFRTATLCSDAPVVSALTMTQYPDTPYEFWALRASVTDPACMDRLSFFWDGQVVGRDYSADGDVFEVYLSPHALGLNPVQFFGQSKELRVQAYSLGGDVTVQTTTIIVPNRPIPATVHGPADEQLVYTPGSTTPADARLSVTVYGAQFAWGCTSPYEPAANTPPGVSPVLCSDVVSPVNSLRFRLDGVTQHTQPPAGLITTYDLNVGGLSLGDHTLEVCGLVGSSDWRCDQQALRVEQGSADLLVSRSVTRVGSYFQVAVRLRNQGVLTAYIENVFDNAVGFQHASKALSGDYAARPFSYNPITRASVINLEDSGSPVPILPGQEYTFQYVMSPLLFENSGSYAIGGQPMLIVWRNGSPSATVQHKSVVRVNQFVYDGAGGPLLALADMVTAAFGSSDYVLVTNPARLQALYNADQVPALLGQMAHLAYLKNGVLGYLDSHDAALLDRLVDPRKGLHWTASLHPNFGVKNKGYMLIVGETEIVPSFYVGESHFTTYAGIPDHVYESDLPYANTGGNTARPELVIGRLIGNDAAALQTPLSLIINVYEGTGGRTFNRSHALLISGAGDGDTSQFIPTVNIIRDILNADGWAVTRFHAAENPGGDDTDFNTWKPWAINQDVLLFRDHGNTNNWGGMLSSGNVSSLNLEQGNSAPFGFGVACLAGNYERDGDYNLAEAFLEYGGAAYIGSTEISERSTNSYAAKAFFRRWPVTDSIGVAFNNTKIAVWDTDSGWEAYDHEKLWAYEYNLYGCPKYGQTSGAAVTAAPTASLAPDAQLPIQIPDYTLTAVDGYDQVEIPGGLLRLTPGGFQTPYWSARVDYPAGQRVTAVHLTTLGTPTVVSGLNLPLTAPGMDCEGCPALPPPDPLDTAGWVPDLAQKYDWRVEENSDGSSTLWLAVYPFFYNADTTDALFYQDFLFTVDTVAADVQIDAWLAASDAVGVGETAVFNLILHNDGAVQDVVVEAAIKPLVVEESVDGLPLRLLSDLSGAASLDLAWDTTGAAPGVYRAEVRLRDLQGNLLDSETTEFRVGILAGEGVALTAVPDFFQPGDDITLAFGFRNSGDVALDGTAVIQVHSANGLTLAAEFTHTITALAPGATVNLNDIWDTTAVAGDDYRVVAYVKFGGGVSEPLQAQINTQRRVYLPALMRP